MNEFTWYTSVVGIVAATMLLVSIVKRAFGNVAYANTVPTWVYAVGISGLLTFLTNRVWATLPGDLWQNLMQAVMMAGTASGFYEWLKSPSAPLAASAISAGVIVEPKNAPDRINAAALVDLKKIGPLVLILALAGGSVGCASTGVRHIATVSAVAAHSTLAAVQDTEMLLACGKPTAPAPPACVPADVHRENSAKLVTAFDADIAVATTIRDWPALGPPPTSIGALLGQITVAINYVLAHLPPGILTTKLLTQIGATK